MPDQPARVAPAPAAIRCAHPSRAISTPPRPRAKWVENYAPLQEGGSRASAGRGGGYKGAIFYADFCVYGSYSRLGFAVVQRKRPERSQSSVPAVIPDDSSAAMYRYCTTLAAEPYSMGCVVPSIIGATEKVRSSIDAVVWVWRSVMASRSCWQDLWPLNPNVRQHEIADSASNRARKCRIFLDVLQVRAKRAAQAQVI